MFGPIVAKTKWNVGDFSDALQLGKLRYVLGRDLETFYGRCFRNAIAEHPNVLQESSDIIEKTRTAVNQCLMDINKRNLSAVYVKISVEQIGEDKKRPLSIKEVFLYSFRAPRRWLINVQKRAEYISCVQSKK